jgi:predicted metal-binding membrane protein
MSAWAYRHPEWAVLGVSLLGWVLLARFTWLPPMMRNPMPGMEHAHPTVGGGIAAAFGHELLAWVLMLIAMMLPTTVPAVRYVAFASRRARRQRSVLAFGLGYLAAWLPLGVLVSLLLAVLPPFGAVPVAIAIGLAGAWELTPAKRLALRCCHRTSPVRFDGLAADRSAAGFGWKHGRTCVLIGGPAMIALAALRHPAIATVIVAVIMFGQKIIRRSERWTPGVAVGGVLAGLLVLGMQ